MNPALRRGLLLAVLGLLAGSVGPAAATPIGAHAPPAYGGECSPGLSLNVSSSGSSAPLFVSFSLSEPWGAPDSVNWSFGDGSTYAGSGDGLLAPEHLYEYPGSFDVSVSLSKGSDSGACGVTVVVAPSPLAVRVQADPISGSAPLTVHFSAVITGGTGTFLSAVWSFGDGRTATGFNVSYTYATPGSYNASFALVDSANQSAQGYQLIAVASTGDGSSGPRSGVDPTLLEGVALGVGVAVLGVILVERLRLRSRRDAPAGPEGGPEPGPPGGPSPPAVPAFPGPAGEPPVPSAAPVTGPRAELATAGAQEPATPDAAPGTAPEVSSSLAAAPAAAVRRPRLSQRVLVHLYLQGHLADGEIAPPGFTQGGMAEALGVAQSPLSGVLRRLVVAGILTQDTRHVRGEDRRLRVYRLTPLGETLAKDLYRAREKPSPGAPADPENPL